MLPWVGVFLTPGAQAPNVLYHVHALAGVDHLSTPYREHGRGRCWALDSKAGPGARCTGLRGAEMPLAPVLGVACGAGAGPLLGWERMSTFVP